MIFGERMSNKSTEKILGPSWDSTLLKPKSLETNTRLARQKKRVSLRVAWTQSYSHFRQSAHIHVLYNCQLTLTILILTILTLTIIVNINIDTDHLETNNIDTDDHCQHQY